MEGEHFVNNLYKIHCDCAEYMLLSYKKLATASSFLKGHEPCCAVDGNEGTDWISKESKIGEWLCVDLGAVKSVHAVRFSCNAAASLYGSADGKDYALLGEEGGEQNLEKVVVLEKALRLRFLKLVFNSPASKGFLVNSFEVLGFGNGKAAKAVEAAFAIRTSERAAIIRWNKVSTAIGYRIRLGKSADKLNEVKTVYGADSVNVELPGGAASELYYAVDSVNENGVTKGEVNRIGFKVSKVL